MAEQRRAPHRHYTEFALAVEPAADGRYRVCLIDDVDGGVDQEIASPFTGNEMRDVATWLFERNVTHARLNATRSMGKRLYDALMEGGIEGHFVNATRACDEETGLRIRLRLPAQGDLGGRPLRQVAWEVLHDRREFLALSWRTPVVRSRQVPAPAQASLRVEPPLRILAMRADPPNPWATVTEEHIALLRTALSLLEDEGLVELVEVERPTTLTALREQVRSHQVHVFHFVGHGKFDPQLGGQLLFEDAQGQADWVPARVIAQTLCDVTTLRLAVLNACSGALSPSDDPFAGVAEALVEGGVQAVVAHQGPIPVKTALVLAHEFYASLALGFPVEACLAEARKAISGESDLLRPTLEWALPVLWMRSGDGQLFDIG